MILEPEFLMKQSVDDGGYVHDDEGGSNQAENSFTRVKKHPHNNVENIDAKAMQLNKRAFLQVFDCIHSSAFESKYFLVVNWGTPMSKLM